MSQLTNTPRPISEVIWEVKCFDPNETTNTNYNLYHFPARPIMLASIDLTLRNFPGKIRLSNTGPYNGKITAYDDDSGCVLIEATAIPFQLSNAAIDMWPVED